MIQPIPNLKNNPFHEFLTNKKWSIVRHFILILIVLVNFELFDISGAKKHALLYNIPFSVSYLGDVVSAIFAILLIYVNLYYLYPKFLKKGFYSKYAIGVFCCLVILYFSMIGFENYFLSQSISYQQHFNDYHEDGFIQTMTYPFVFLGSTTGFKIFKTWIEDQKIVAQLQEEKLKAELNQLKNQVNPHFLFNTLNNLNVLITTNPEKASQITLGLSDVLRYQIYDSQYDVVLLSKEIELIMQYLELEKIRRDNLKTNIKVQGSVSGILVPPLLFINFVDNAIKHNTFKSDALINIFFKVEKRFLIFEIINTKDLTNKQTKKGGFGIANISKRLDLLYENNYSLDIANEEKLFTVELKFPI